MVICNVCQKKQTKYFSYRKYSYYRCSSCKLVSTLPLPTNKVIKAHYLRKFLNGNYSLLLKYDKEYRNVYKDFIKILTNIVADQNQKPSNMSVLDIGCFTGTFLVMLKKLGYKVTGLELQDEAVEIAKKRLPKRIFSSDIMTDKIPGESFDIVSLLGLIEHVKDPTKLLKKCSKLMKPGSLMLIQTPNSSSLPAKVLKKYWPPFAPVEHIHLFSRESLELLLEKNGFEIVVSKNHVKKLPVSYVYHMLNNFGPEFAKLAKPIYSFMPKSFREAILPFYVGEMIVVGRKLPKN